MTSAAPEGAPAPHRAVLAVDQGTTNTKALLVTAAGSVLSSASRAVGVRCPRPGWVEQDASELWTATADAARAAISAMPEVEVVGLALSTQRESAIAWHAGTGEPLGPVLGWQDARTAPECDLLRDAWGAAVERTTGLPLDPMYSAPKLRWLIDAAVRDGVDVEQIRVGTVDSWLLHRLTGRHLTEAGNASRTLLLDLHGLRWSEELLEAFSVPASALPEVLASDGDFGAVGRIPGLERLEGVPVLAVMADSHAALYAQGCRRPGQAKATYGTGSSVMTPCESSAVAAGSGVTTTLAWLTSCGATYALEGNIIASGSALEAVARWLGLDGGAAVSAVAASAPDSGGVALVPAFAGLGAPYWDREAQGVVTGLTTGTTREQLARAALEGVAHQVADVVEAMERATGIDLDVLNADGGATASGLLMQLQADLVGRPVRVADVAEASALGVAQLAWTRSGAPAPATGEGRMYVPLLDRASRDRQRAVWAAAVARSRGIGVGARADAHHERKN
ncbi:MAG: FGGY family carbohydrate kinase [Candidatus Nanopelagicales bacterium]